MILTDGTHMVSTVSARELHQFAREMGITRWYYHRHPTHPHYDLMTPDAVARAIAAGAQKVASKQIILQAWWSDRKATSVQA